jgi:hypothetical protein
VLLEDVNTTSLLRDSTSPGPSTASEDSLKKRICRGIVSVAGFLNVINSTAAKEVRLELLLVLFVTHESTGPRAHYEYKSTRHS